MEFEKAIVVILNKVTEQTEDVDLWMPPETTREKCLQEKLSELHELLEITLTSEIV